MAIWRWKGKKNTHSLTFCPFFPLQWWEKKSKSNKSPDSRLELRWRKRVEPQSSKLLEWTVSACAYFWRLLPLSGNHKYKIMNRKWYLYAPTLSFGGSREAKIRQSVKSWLGIATTWARDRLPIRTHLGRLMYDI